MLLEFDADVFRWDARSDAWFFLALPDDLSDDVREIPRMPRGFGAVRVLARVGGTTWRTSIFPDGGRGAYVLPLKKKVRLDEQISEGDVVTVHLEVLDA